MLDAGFSILDTRYWMLVIPAKASAGKKRLVYIAISGTSQLGQQNPQGYESTCPAQFSPFWFAESENEASDQTANATLERITIGMIFEPSKWYDVNQEFKYANYK